ncbi:MAG: 1-deoxy-D-xylulose-5-phosphate reductoisomerase [Clostridiaceae bacterium]|jgi:1-deoxy-D-xylulose-5-phosphate reductoisomerase|nr:1-deoxy-D-xylulose-5-phosphate reductoisomerase [Clostridiaceae bacterium]
MSIDCDAPRAKNAVIGSIGCDMPHAKNAVIIGSTGSIGGQALEVIRDGVDVDVFALSCGGNLELFKRQIEEFSPRYIYAEALASDAKARKNFLSSLRTANGARSPEFAASNAELAAIDGADTVLLASAGLAGIEPAIAALKSGKTLALASKEALVSAGEFLLLEAERSGGKIIPVDSEHSAIFQCLEGACGNPIKRIILTASGGAFRDYPLERMKTVTPEEALAHPVWRMGKKVTIDSASLMNKGLEFIEAMRLFSVSPDKIEVVIHRESIVHSAVEFYDNAVIAMLAPPDMRIPIRYALTYPKRVQGLPDALDFAALQTLTFGKPDLIRFPCLGLAISAAKEGGAAPAVLCAADNAAVALFLQKKIGFTDIPRLTEGALNRYSREKYAGVEDLIRIINAAEKYTYTEACV